MKKQNKLYIHYGYDDPDEAPILLTTSDLQFAKQNLRDFGGALYQYTIVGEKDLVDERKIT